MSIDVEDWYHSRHVTSLSNNPNSDVLNFKDLYNLDYKLLERPLSSLLQLFEQKAIKATFFIVGDLIPDNLEILKAIVNAGHELACHELHHIEYVGSGGKAEVSLFKSNVGTSKKLLEDLTGKPIIGFRAPSAYYRPWMTEVLLELGFKYDSSIAVNSLFNKYETNLTGINTAPFILDNTQLKASTSDKGLVELPWPYINIAGFKIPTGGGPVMRYFGANTMIYGLKQSLKRGDTVFYCHPLDISEDKLPDVISESRKRFWRGRGVSAFRSLQTILNAFDSGVFVKCEDAYIRHAQKHVQGINI